MKGDAIWRQSTFRSWRMFPSSVSHARRPAVAPSTISSPSAPSGGRPSAAIWRRTESLPQFITRSRSIFSPPMPTWGSRREASRSRRGRPRRFCRCRSIRSLASTTRVEWPRKSGTSSRRRLTMRVALFSPLPPSPTGVADYSQLLLQGLSRRFPMEAYTNGPIASPLSAPCYAWQEVDKRQSIEPKALPLYQMGNSLHHDFIYPFAFRHPGVLVLHDLVLHHSRLAMYMKSPEVANYRADMGDTAKRDRALAKLSQYTAEVEAAYPSHGSAVAEIAIRMGGGRLLYQYPLHELLVKRNKMTLVHSRAAPHEIAQSCPENTVRVVRMGMELPEVTPRREARRQLGLGSQTILTSFGCGRPDMRSS